MSTPSASFRLPVSFETAFALLKEAYKLDVESRECMFVDDDDTAANIRAIAAALTDRTSPKWGLMLCGLYGNGKTTALYALKNVIQLLSRNGYFRNEEQRIVQKGLRIISATELVNTATATPDEFDVIMGVPNLAIDDLGREPAESSNFGNYSRPMCDLLEHRYSRRLFTAISTNLKVDEIRPRYGDRIAERLTQMIEIVPFRNGSYRNEQPEQI